MQFTIKFVSGKPAAEEIKNTIFHTKYAQMKIVADDKIPFLKGALEQYSKVLYLPGREINNEVLKDADALVIRTRTKCSEKLLSGTGVKFIGTATIGYDHIDTAYCDANGIRWTNAPGCNSSSVQQYIISSLLRIARKEGRSLRGMTLGVVGKGNVGSKVAHFADLLGMRVLVNDPPRAREEGSQGYTDLSTLLKESDFLTLHVPLNRKGSDITFHLMDENKFASLKEGAWFINSSRGEVTVSAALKKALLSGKLGGAVIDVWENEPVPDCSLVDLCYITTPHIAGYSTDGKANGTAMTVNALTEFFGLSKEKWYPSAVPEPAEPLIVIECHEKTDEEILFEAVMHSYDVSADSEELKDSPGDFERLRGDYPLRREFGSYTVKLINPSSSVYSYIMSFGFNVIS